MSTATGAVGDASGVHPDESSLAMSQADQVTRARILLSRMASLSSISERTFLEGFG